ncbi:hypothetical protein CAEBREN_07965 [Caenorhabditis brenneri]|uniref:Uncharacterized protein n=1 Tax=Caenorhabditis brenneri TaxID=135651 RepID=G0NP92_CAEBE|nr:hypothetical protein CAEBREN_07965 [Caenorhabditis brenneri]
MSSPTGEELDRTLQPNESKSPSPPRDIPPKAASPDLPDEEEFQETLRKIGEKHKNMNKNELIQSATKMGPTARRFNKDEDDEDDYGGDSDEEDEQSSSTKNSKGRQLDAMRRSTETRESSIRKDDPLTGSMSWVSADTLNRLPSDPRYMPPDTSPELSDDEEFWERIRKIKEKYMNTTYQSETEEEPISRRTDEDDDDISSSRRDDPLTGSKSWVSAEELNRLPSDPRYMPPDTSTELSDDEEFWERIRKIVEEHKNENKNDLIQPATKMKQTSRKFDKDEDDRDAYVGDSDEEDEHSSSTKNSKGRQMDAMRRSTETRESSSRRDVFSTNAPKSKNTFDPTRRRSSDVFQRKSEEKSRKDDSDEDSDDGRGEGLLKTVVRSKNEREEMKRGMVGTSRGSTSWREESSRPRDTSRSRSRHRERFLSRLSPWRRDLIDAQEALIDVMVKQRRAKLNSRLLRRAPSDSTGHEGLDAVNNEFDADSSGIVGRDSDDERLQSSKQRRHVPPSEKIPRRRMEESRIEAPNDSDEPMSDDDDKTPLGYLPSKFGGWRASNEPKSSRPKPSEPTRITGDWDELPTSSGAAKTPKRGINQATMTDFFKPAPRPGQERKISDQPPHQEPLGFKELARMSKKLEKGRRELQLLNDKIESKRRAAKDAERWRPKSPVREPTRITGDWNELPTSSEAAKTAKQGVKRPTMTDFFKPAPRPGQERRGSDQPPRRDPLRFKEAARMANEREKRRRELQLLKEQMEKERAIQEKYARRKKQKRKRRATKEAKRWRPKSPVRDPLTGSMSWLSADELDRLPSAPRDMPPYTSPELSDEEEFRETLRKIGEKYKNETIQSETKEEPISRKTDEDDYDFDELEFYEKIRKIGEKYENERKNRLTHS